MNELHLKFHLETGSGKVARRIYPSAYFDEDDCHITILPDNEREMKIPTDEYVEWLEELALKQVRVEGKFPQSFRDTLTAEIGNGYYGDIGDDVYPDAAANQILDRIEKYFKNGK